jgi:ubiquinone/menaquinone biosynthesis C-methylase UbiE
VFINQSGETPSYLSDFWCNALSNLDENTSIMDVACGGGSIFMNLDSDHRYALYGADISNEALQQASSKIKNLNIIKCSADTIPLEDRTIDLLVSQFGIEYSGINGFVEAIRVLKDRGTFIFLTHCKDGYIDALNKGKLDGALLVKSTDFIDKALNLTKSLYDNNQPEFEKCHDLFSQVEPKLFKYTQTYPNGVHAHLYNEFRKLLLNKDRYKKDDIVNWLTSMAQEVEVNIIRLEQMRRAALSESELKNIQKHLKDSGVNTFSYEKFYDANQSLPIAWLIKGTKE